MGVLRYLSTLARHSTQQYRLSLSNTYTLNSQLDSLCSVLQNLLRPVGPKFFTPSTHSILRTSFRTCQLVNKVPEETSMPLPIHNSCLMSHLHCVKTDSNHQLLRNLSLGLLHYCLIALKQNVCPTFSHTTCFPFAKTHPSL